MQQTQEAAAEAKAQGNGAFHFVAHGSVVELQLFQGIPQILVLGAVGGVNAGEHHGLHRPVTRQRLRSGIFHRGDGIAHLGIGNGFDGSGDVAHFSGSQGIQGAQSCGSHGTHLHHLINRAGGHHFNIHAGLDGALLDPGVDDDTPVRIILAVKNQCLQRRFPVAGGSGNVFDNHFQHAVNIDAILGGDFRGILGGDADNVLHLGFDFRRAGGGQVDFVDHRQHFQPCVNGKVGIGQGLGFHTLGSVHHQHRAFAGGKRAGHLIVKVHMARGVDQVQGVGFPVVGGVVQGNGGCLDGDAPLPL